jgi:cell division protein FtsB
MPALNHASQRLLITARPAPAGEAATGWQAWLQRARDMRRKGATLLLMAICAAVGGYVVLGRDGLVAYRQKEAQSRALAHQIQALQQENQRLALHDQRLRTDPDTIEYEARHQMHYARPGEVIYTLPVSPDESQK